MTADHGSTLETLRNNGLKISRKRLKTNSQTRARGRSSGKASQRGGSASLSAGERAGLKVVPVTFENFDGNFELHGGPWGFDRAEFSLRMRGLESGLNEVLLSITHPDGFVQRLVVTIVAFYSFASGASNQYNCLCLEERGVKRLLKGFQKMRHDITIEGRYD